MHELHNKKEARTANTGFASGGVTCKLGALCYNSSVVLVESFVLRNPPERKALETLWYIVLNIQPMTNSFHYDKKIASTIATLRKLKGIKQIVVADALCVDQSVYSRIEKGETHITTGQLKIISESLETSVFQIISIVEHEMEILTTSNPKNSLPDLITNYILNFHSHETIETFTIEDYQKVIEIINAKIRNLKG